MEESSELIETSEIKRIVGEILSSKLPSKERYIHFEKKYPEFTNHLSTLVQMACEPGFDLERFNYMMEMKDKIANKQETEDSAAVKVGQSLFNEFVTPVIGKQ